MSFAGAFLSDRKGRMVMNIAGGGEPEIMEVELP